MSMMIVIHLIHKYWVIFVPSLFYSTTSLATCFVLLNSSDFFTGFDTEGLGPAVFHGGEAEALTRLERHLERKVKNC